MVDNVITVSIGNSRKITTRPAWLTDKGMILRFVGVDLPNYYVVDFSKSLTEQALPVIGTPEGVAIPSELFHNSDKIFAWLRLTQGDNVHFTVYQITIPLQQRSEISNSQPTPEQEDIIDQAIEALNEASVDARLGGGGIFGKTYEPMFGGAFTVETAVDAGHGSHPYASTGIAGRIDKRYGYRVTFDGTEYVLPCQLLFYEYGDPANIKVVEHLGNVGLYRSSMTGLLNDVYNVPFLVASDTEGGSDPDTIRLYTKTAGSHTVLVERIVLDAAKVPATLIYGDEYVPFRNTHKLSTFEVFSVGCNKFPSNPRFAYAFGYGNSVSAEGAVAFGVLHQVSSNGALASGYGNIASGPYSVATGLFNQAAGNSSHAEGMYATAGEPYAHAEGEACKAMAKGSHVEGGGNNATSSQMYAHISGVNNATTNETGKTVTITRYNQDGTVAGTVSRTLGKYAEVIGNGDSDNARSNARTLDWDGNEELAGGLTLGKGTENETAITPAQLKALLNLI